jgi:hypothetical protein
VRPRRIALLAAPLVTALAVSLGVATSGAGVPQASSSASGNVGSAAAGSAGAPSSATDERSFGTSRSIERVPLVNHRVPRARGRLWTTSNLDLRAEPRKSSRVAGLLRSGKQVPVTGRRQGPYTEVIVDQVGRWVTTDYLSKDKAPAALGLVDRPCPGTEGTENGLTSSAVRVYRAVCNNFPQITTYGGYDAHGEHASGRAIDIMTSDTALGDRIKSFLQANASALNLYDIIFQQHIWTPERAGEGWRSMPDRGSATANHFDHVHVSVN